MAEVNFLVKKGLTVPKGSAATPAVIFDASDPNTGIYSPGADQVAISTNGTGRLFVDSSGNVTIANEKLNAIRVGLGAGAVSTNTALGDGALTFNTTGSNNTAVGKNTLYYVVNGANNTAVGATALQQTTGSNNTGVGLGALHTSNSGSDNVAVGYLSLYYNNSGANNTGIGRYSLVSNTTGNNNIGIGYNAGQSITTGSNNVIIGNIAGTSSLANTIILGDGAGNERLRIDSSGRLGLGTSSPVFLTDILSGTANTGANVNNPSQLSVTGPNKSLTAGGATVFINSNSDLAIDTGGSIALTGRNTTSSTTSIVWGVVKGAKENATSTNTAGYLAFATANHASGGLVEAIRIDSSQRVGVGTTNPGYLIDVGGASQGTPTINCFGPAADNNWAGGIRFASNNGTTVTSTINASIGGLLFDYGGTERARIDASGRLLVGTSTGLSTAFAGSGQLQVAKDGINAAQIFGFSSAGQDYTPCLEFGRARGTQASPSAALSGDWLGSVNFYGHDGTQSIPAAYITARADGPTGTNDMPGRLVFSTTADGAAAPSVRMTLFSNGDIRAVETASAYFYPGIDNSIYLGSPSFRYNLVYSVNGTASSSDEREKTEINDAALGIDFIKSLRPVSYKWKVGHNDVEAGDEGDVVIPRPGLRTHWGFLAQDVKQAADQAGVDFGGWILTDVDNPESPQGLRYQQFIAPLTKALQEAIAKIETLEAKVAALETP